MKVKLESHNYIVKLVCDIFNKVHCIVVFTVLYNAVNSVIVFYRYVKNVYLKIYTTLTLQVCKTTT